MNTKSLNFTKIIIEIVFISFAVFLGLLVGQWKEDYNNKRLAIKNTESIYNELIENRITIKMYLENHQKLIDKYNSTLATFEKERISELNKIDFYYNFELLNSSAWSTAKLTQAVSFMKFDLVKNISIIYDFQENYTFLITDHVKRSMYQTFEHDTKIDYYEFISDRNFLTKIIQYEVGLIKFYNYNINLIENI